MAGGSEELVLTMTGSRSEAEQGADQRESAQLLKKAKAGDASAFKQIIIQHQRQVLMTALRLLGSLELAQDASQEVFLRLYKYLHKHSDTRKFPPWLYRVTVNVCRDLNRRRQKNSMLSLDELQHNGSLGEVADSTDLELTLTRAEQRDIVAKALKTLSGKEREALVLRDIQGLPTKTVARILGSSEATIRSQVSTARVKIKRFAEHFLGRKS